MDAQQITETLARMQKNLQGIDSARQQVQQVATAYDGTRTQIETLATRIHELSEDINNVVRSISENQALISQNNQSQLDKMEQSAGELRNAAQNIQTQFSQECDRASSKLSTATATTVSTLQESVDNTIKALKEKADTEIQRISNEIDAFKTAATQVQTNLKDEAAHVKRNFKDELSESQEAHKSAEQDIVNGFTESVNNCIQSLNDTKGDLEQVLEQYRGVINEFQTKLDEKFAPVEESIKKLHEKEDMELKLIGTNKYLLIAILIGVLVTIVLRFV